MAVKKSDLYIIRDEVLYINSLGKQVRRKPRTCIGAWVYFEAMYEDILYSEANWISAKGLEEDGEKNIDSAKRLLVDTVLQKANQRGK